MAFGNGAFDNGASTETAFAKALKLKKASFIDTFPNGAFGIGF
jgi:hypothetical protein